MKDYIKEGKIIKYYEMIKWIHDEQIKTETQDIATLLFTSRTKRQEDLKKCHSG